MTADTDLLLVRQLACSPANAYRCWTEAEVLKQFFAPEPGETVEAVIEPRAGGRFYTLMRFEEYGDIGGEGCILLADPGRRLVFTSVMGQEFRPLEPAGIDLPFTADITFTHAPGGGCEYRVIARHPDGEVAKRHAEMGFDGGWGTVAGQLDRLAATL